MNLLKKIWTSLGTFKIKSVYFGLILIVTAIFETLGIGIITTLFTAYFLARHLTSMIVLRSDKKEIKI